MKKKMRSRISAQESRFADEFVKSGNATSAYKKAYECGQLSPTQISARAASLKRRSTVKAAIAKLQKKVESELEFGIKDVVDHWIDIATADPNELMSNLRRCCRHCYGRGHHYQWKDKDEFAFALGQALSAKKDAKDKRPALIPSDLGGYGFNFTFRPHPECSECKGEGRLDTFFADTRTLSKKGRRLFAGIKQTQNGMQVMTRDQDAALANLAKFYGMFVEKHQHTGADGAPLISASMTLPDDPIAAAAAYAQLIKSTARQ